MTYFNLFSNILIAKGANRILISDLQRNISELYPLELNDLIEELKVHSVEEVMQLYDNESKELLQKYLDFLIEKEYGFITRNNWDKNFPSFSKEFHDYSIISNIFLELDSLTVLDKIKSCIESLGIKHIVIYCKRILSFDEIVEIDKKFKNSSLESIEIFLKFDNSINKKLIQKLNQNTQRIHSIIFYNCKKIPFKINDEFKFIVNFTQQDLKISSCGKINLDYFNTNLSKVLEAFNYNSCLYKKVGIDIHGNIKNCPAMPQNFGNIKDTTLEKAVNHLDFKKYWNLTKDNIEICKDCEFRYICTDCRAYTERTNNNNDGLDISKPLKCGYNPYTGEWQEWSTSPLKQKAIQHYGMEKII